MKKRTRQVNEAPSLKQDPIREFLASYANRWSRVGVATVGAAVIAAQLTAVGFAYEVKINGDHSNGDIPMIASTFDSDGQRWIEVAESDKNNKAAAPKAEEKKAEPAKAEPTKASEPATAAAPTPKAEEKKGGGDNKPAPAQSSGSGSGATSSGSTGGGNKPSGGTTTTTAGTLPGGTMGRSGSNPDGGGVDKPYSADGQTAGSQPNTGFQDGNNGCGQDKRLDGGGDDNNGWCGFKPKPEKPNNTGLTRVNPPAGNPAIIVKNNTDNNKGEVKFGNNDKAQLNVDEKDKDKVDIKKSDTEKDVVTIKVKGEDQDRVKVRVIDNDSVDINISDHDKVTVKIADKDKDKILFTVNPNNPNQGFFELVNADRDQVKFNGYIGPNGMFILDVTTGLATNPAAQVGGIALIVPGVPILPVAPIAPPAPIVQAAPVIPAAPAVIAAPVVVAAPVAVVESPVAAAPAAQVVQVAPAPLPAPVVQVVPVAPAVQASVPATPQVAPAAVQAAPAVSVPAVNVQQPAPLPIAMQLAPLMPLNVVQAEAVATLLGTGVTPSQVSAMTAGEIQRTAEVKGVSPSDFVAVLGAQFRRPISNVQPSAMSATGGPSTGLIAAGLAMLSGAGLFLRRIGRNRD